MTTYDHIENFASALDMLENGNRVAREGWNGKGMWLVKLDGVRVPLFIRNGTTYGGDHVEYEIPPFIALKAADGKMYPWTPSQADMLAKDWKVLTGGV